jgi:hypothetical protein
MPQRDRIPGQLRLLLWTDSPVPLDGAMRSEIVKVLAQLLASAVEAPPSGLEANDESR